MNIYFCTLRYLIKTGFKWKIFGTFQYSPIHWTCDSFRFSELSQRFSFSLAFTPISLNTKSFTGARKLEQVAGPLDQTVTRFYSQILRIIDHNPDLPGKYFQNDLIGLILQRILNRLYRILNRKFEFVVMVVFEFFLLKRKRFISEMNINYVILCKGALVTRHEGAGNTDISSGNISKAPI